jgi:hypothetical protein
VSKKNQAAIDKVLAYLNGRNSASPLAIREATGLTKPEFLGAARVLKREGRIVSVGATTNLVWRIADANEAPPPSTIRRTRKTTTKKTRKTARTRTRRAPTAEASTSTPAPALDIAMDDAGRVRLAREGAPPFVLQTPDDHARLYAFLDRMEPVWSAP